MISAIRFFVWISLQCCLLQPVCLLFDLNQCLDPLTVFCETRILRVCCDEFTEFLFVIRRVFVCFFAVCINIKFCFLYNGLSKSDRFWINAWRVIFIYWLWINEIVCSTVRFDLFKIHTHIPFTNTIYAMFVIWKNIVDIAMCFMNFISKYRRRSFWTYYTSESFITLFCLLLYSLN